MSFSFSRGVIYVNGRVLPSIRRRVELFITSELDIQEKPTGEAYLRWADELFRAHGQIGLKVELATLQGGGTWDRGVEGMMMT